MQDVVFQGYFNIIFLLYELAFREFPEETILLGIGQASQLAAFIHDVLWQNSLFDRGIYLAEVHSVVEATIILHPILGFLWHTNIWLVSSPTIQALIQIVDSLQFQCLEYTFSPGDLLKVVAFWLICWDFSVDTKLCLFLKPVTLLCHPRANIIHSKILVQASLYFRGFYSYFLWLTGSNVQMEIESMIVCNFAYPVIMAISVHEIIFAVQ